MDPENRAQIAGNPLRGRQICCATDLWLLWSSPVLRWLLRSLAAGLREEARSAEFGIERYLPEVAHSHSGWVSFEASRVERLEGGPSRRMLNPFPDGDSLDVL